MSRRRQSKKRVKSLMWMIVLTGMLSILSTYAWFSTNRVVTLSNIKAKVAAAEGLQISLDGENWSSTIDFSQTSFFTLDSDGTTQIKTAVGNKNTYNWPNELNPVSTGGTTATKDLTFWAGEVKDDGKYLVNVAENTKNLISFDLYFKNASSNTFDYLLLNQGSKIIIDATNGVENTGLEYSVRFGLLLYGSTAALTADGGTVRDLGAGTPAACIWEPNSQKHIGEVINNDLRIGKGTVETADDVMDFRTLALKAAPGATDLINVSTIGSTTFLQEQHTLQTETGEIGQALYMPKSSSTNATGKTALDATDDAADYLTLQGNSIKKARFYIWLEGQDPDCIDTASTGKQLDILISFTKPGGNAQNGGSGGGAGEDGGGTGG
ncbi:MAG: hypothetical protein HUJ68_12580 [Clostridia bacterium]|mgnify:CR=1 FL=1|nr:hypothetical protein [Clostridia bacterium]